MALQVKGPGVGSDVGGLLLWIPDADASHRRGMAHLEQRGATLLLAATRGQDYGAFERRTPDRRFHDALKRHIGRNMQAAFDQITARIQQDSSAGLGRLVQHRLDRGSAIAAAISPGAPYAYRERVLFVGRVAGQKRQEGQNRQGAPGKQADPL